MNSRNTRNNWRTSAPYWGVALSALAAALAPQGAWAQTSGASAAPSAPAAGPVTNRGAANQVTQLGEIVVTGTLLRNVVPAGAQAVTLTEQAIKSTGATSTDQVLASIPQISSFGNLQTANAGGTQLTVNRINLRNLPQGVGGGSPTLVLLDGHRMVGAGVKQSYPDPDVIPPALIQRVEVLTDGGSASYGSDAVGGVVNFITKRSFDGVEAALRQGFADSYQSTDINLTVGKAWDKGDVFVGYNFARHDPLFGHDRDYIKNIDYTTGLPQDRSCSPANVIQGGALYAVTNGNSLTPGTANLCDQSKNKSYYPEETRQSVMGGFHQSLSDSLEFQLKGYYSNRRDVADNGPLQATAAVTSTNPNYISTGGGSTASQSVLFDFGPAGGREVIDTHLWSFGITPSLTWKIGHDWQATALYNYGQSKTTANDPQVNNTLLNADVAAGTINPYNVGASRGDALSQVLNWTNFGIGKDILNNAKLTFDGPLFTLPGGEVRLAVGGEYIREAYKGTTVTNTLQNVAIAPLNSASRNVKSVFGELNVPLVSPSNDIPLIDSLIVAGSIRYDRYSDFGSNVAPNVGVTWKPIDWISLRGRWNKSFQAPSVVQLSQAASPSTGVFPAFIVSAVPLLKNPAVPFNGGPIVAVQGTVSPLQPQKAKDYNLGFDISPPVIEGLNLHFTYFNIVYSGQISAPPLGSGPFYSVSSFAPLYIMTPTIAQVQSFLTAAGATPSDIANAIANVNAQGGNAYVVADIRARNLGISKVNGFDFGFDYHRNVSFGSIDASYSGSFTNRAVSAADGVNFLPNQAGVDGTRFNSIGRIGANVGENWQGVFTWNHLAGFKLSVPAQLNQMDVGSFDTFDLFVQYDIKREGLAPINLSLSINNIFDTSPPLYRGVAAATAGGYWNGSTIGRLFQLGASVTF